jgi:hypothetical protein
MFWVHHLIKVSLQSLTRPAAYGPLETLYYGCPEIAKKVEAVLADLEKNVVETEEGYALKGMSELEQKVYLDNLTKEIFAEFMKYLRDKLGDYYYDVQDYFMERCIAFGIEPLPEKLPRPTPRPVIIEEKKTEEERAAKLKELIEKHKKLEKKLELLKKEIEEIKRK